MSYQRRGDWIQTFTGQQFWPLDPLVEEVHLEDIAHALSNLCRFTGHALRAEAETLMGPASQEWASRLPEYLPRVTIEPWSPERAKREFLARFAELFVEGMACR